MKAFLLKTIEEARGYTLAVAEALPEDYYASTPVPGTWTFGELLNHIAYGVCWWNDNYVQGVSAAWNPPAAKTTKADVLDTLDDAFNGLALSVADLQPQEKVAIGVWSALDHVSHHRGQAILHLRHHGVMPPEYVMVEPAN